MRLPNNITEKFTKVVRPSMFVWSYLVFTLAMFLDGNVGDFSIKPIYLGVLETIIVTITLAYVGSKGVEHTTKIIRESKENKNV